MTKHMRFIGRKHGKYISPQGLMKFLRQVTPLDIPDWRMLYSFRDIRNNTIAFAVRNVNGKWVGGVFKCFIVDPIKTIAKGEEEAPVRWVADLRLVVTEGALRDWVHGIDCMERYITYSKTKLMQMQGTIAHLLSMGEGKFPGVGKTNIAFALAPSKWGCKSPLLVVGKVYPVQVGQSFAGWTWGNKNLTWKPDDERYIAGFRLIFDHLDRSVRGVNVDDRTTITRSSEDYESVVAEILETIEREQGNQLPEGGIEVRSSFQGNTDGTGE